MPLFFFLSNTYNLSFPFPPHLQLLLFYFIYRTTSHIFSSSTSLSSFGAQNRKTIYSSGSFTKRVLIFHHHLLFHYLPLMHKTKNLIFPSKTLEILCFILNPWKNYYSIFFQVISHYIFKHEGNNEFIEK